MPASVKVMLSYDYCHFRENLEQIDPQLKAEWTALQLGTLHMEERAGLLNDWLEERWFERLMADLPPAPSTAKRKEKQKR